MTDASRKIIFYISSASSRISPEKLEKLQTGDEQLPDNMMVRKQVILTHPDLTPEDRGLLLQYASLTHAYNQAAEDDSYIRNGRMKAFADAIAEQAQSPLTTWLGRAYFVISFGRINEDRWAQIVNLACTHQLEKIRRQEDKNYGDARRLANQAFFKDEKALFEAGQTILSESGKALFNRLGDRRELRPRYQLTQQAAPSAPR